MNRALPQDFDIERALLLEAINQKYHYDFRSYCSSSLNRRLAQAMQRFGCPTLSILQDRVLREPELMRQLLAFLTVHVSTMFRDPAYFRALRQSVVPYLRTYPSLKVWIPGCATGEEVYSLAIMLLEEQLLDRTLIYGTDINPTALEKAEAGIYKLDRLAGFSRAYVAAGGISSLSDYYVAGYDAAVFSRRLRERILFSDHSLATDNIFAEVQLISCRNVFIYFDKNLHRRAMALFSGALCRKGFLGLGATESLELYDATGFDPFIREQRIYQKR